MTRKDYVALAEALREARVDIQCKEPAEHVSTLKDGVSYAADHIADALAADNPRFDRTRFLKACGVTQ